MARDLSNNFYVEYPHEIEAERNQLRAQRDALLAAIKRAECPLTDHLYVAKCIEGGWCKCDFGAAIKLAEGK